MITIENGNAEALNMKINNDDVISLQVGGKKVGIFLWKHSGAGKRGVPSVNQADAKNDVDHNFVFVGN